MFEVRTKYEFETSEERDSNERALEVAAGFEPDFGGASLNASRHIGDAGWNMPTFEHAMMLRKQLEIAGFPATIREH